MGRGQGERLRPWHRADLSGAGRGRRHRPARPRRGGARARAGLDPAGAAAGRPVRGRRCRDRGSLPAQRRGAHPGTARHAGRRAPDAPDRHPAQDELRHEPAGLSPRRLSRGLAARLGHAGGGPHRADDALRQCRRRPGRLADAGVRRGHPGPARRTHAVELGRGALASGRAPRLGAPRHHPLRRLADRRGARHRRHRPAALDDAEQPADRHPDHRSQRDGRLRPALRRLQRDAGGRGGLRLCRRLSAPRAHRHADRGRRGCARGWSAASRWTC